MKIFFVLSFLQLLVSCSENLEKTKLIGKYIFNKSEYDTLELKSDGTFFHSVIIKGKILKNSGKWELNDLGNEVKFENFSFLTDRLGRGNWFSRIRFKGNEIHLMYSSENNVYYSKL